MIRHISGLTGRHAIAMSIEYLKLHRYQFCMFPFKRNTPLVKLNRIVDFLQERVSRLYYPGFGAIVSFEVEGDAVEFARSLELWTLAESLGSVKSLFCHPATMTHASMDPDVRKSVGIGDGLVRLSVGLEDVRDLIEDLEQALVGGRVACAR